jgi:hypothetical protein
MAGGAPKLVYRSGYSPFRESEIALLGKTILKIMLCNKLETYCCCPWPKCILRFYDRGVAFRLTWAQGQLHCQTEMQASVLSSGFSVHCRCGARK